MKLYIEVEGGMVTNAYTDDKEANIKFILCDHDSAEQEEDGDGFDFAATNNCDELNSNRSNLRDIF